MALNAFDVNAPDYRKDEDVIDELDISTLFDIKVVENVESK